MKPWMPIAAEGIIVAALVIGIIAGIVWMVKNNQKVADFKLNKPKKDPRWKNRAQIVNFIFGAFTLFVVAAASIWGYNQ